VNDRGDADVPSAGSGCVGPAVSLGEQPHAEAEHRDAEDEVRHPHVALANTDSGRYTSSSRTTTIARRMATVTPMMRRNRPATNQRTAVIAGPVVLSRTPCTAFSMVSAAWAGQSFVSTGFGSARNGGRSARASGGWTSDMGEQPRGCAARVRPPVR
jgi:hypothetical protein